MTTVIVPMGCLAVIFTILTVLWIAINLKEDRKAEEEVRKQKAAKAIQNKPIKFQKEWLNNLLNK